VAASAAGVGRRDGRLGLGDRGHADLDLGRELVWPVASLSAAVAGSSAPASWTMIVPFITAAWTTQMYS
jgi:hypothetical protein